MDYEFTPAYQFLFHIDHLNVFNQVTLNTTYTGFRPVIYL